MRHEARIASGVTMAVSSTMSRPSPSTPRKYWMPSDGTQSNFSTNCSPPDLASKCSHMQMRAAEADQAGRQREAAHEIFPFRAEAGDDDAAEERNER